VTAFIVVIAVIFALLIFMWVAIGWEPGPGPADVAIAYEGAWDDLDFDLLYDLSGEELRDGMRRERFVAAKRAAYEKSAVSSRLGARVSIETSVTGHQTALVVTRVETAEGIVHDNVMLEKRSNGWVVVSYSLRPDEQRSDEQRSDERHADEPHVGEPQTDEQRAGQQRPPEQSATS